MGRRVATAGQPPSRRNAIAVGDQHWAVDIVVSRAPQLNNDNDDRQKADQDTGAPGAGKRAGRDG
jgi:hypothetical protein